VNFDALYAWPRRQPLCRDVRLLAAHVAAAELDVAQVPGRSAESRRIRVALLFNALTGLAPVADAAAFAAASDHAHARMELERLWLGDAWLLDDEETETVADALADLELEEYLTGIAASLATRRNERGRLPAPPR
jgi:hypothetical protein